MCGRFTLTLEVPELQQFLDLGNISLEIKPRYNISPGQDILVLSNNDDYKLSYMRWGLIPFWAKDKKIGYKLINARSETIDQKPSYRYAFDKRRCIILADGFFEWKKDSLEQQKPIPYYFFLENHKPFGFAGLWEKWKSEDNNEEIFSCTIITCHANNSVSKIHSRMPVIIEKNDFDRWINTDNKEQINNLLVPYNKKDKLYFHQVSRYVNSPINDDVNIINEINS